MKDTEWLPYWLMLLIFGTTTGYDLQCPAKSEWRLKANISCNSEDKYVCLFHLLEKKYEENCLGSDLSSIGNKLVFQPLFNLAECNIGRYQPVVFTTHGNSECMFLKSKCDDEGQVIYSTGSTRNDTTCHCDYTKGYAFITRPKNSCFCNPSEEDCSCFRVNCSKLSPDYICTTDGEKIITNATCKEICPQKTINRHNQTVTYIKGSIKQYVNADLVPFIILILSSVSLVTVVLLVIVFEYKESELQRKRARHARNEERKELIQKGECGKHHFARLVFIGKNGVGKTSLMRRLLWQNKKDVLSTQSTDGIEIGKCNINVRNGRWSLSDKIDNDLARLIHTVYTEKKRNAADAAGQIIPSIDFYQMHSRYNHSNRLSVVSSFSSFMDDVSENKTTSANTNEVEPRSQTSSDETVSFVTDIKRGNANISVHEIRDNVEYLNENAIKTNESEKENEQAIEKDENINKMTSAIMELCLQRQGGDAQQDPLAFCWLWDFAGEKDYYATHQVFLSTCAVYLLVTDSLEFSTAKTLWTDMEDSAQYVNFWFDAIHCYWSTTKKGRLDPPIIVVCTNQDQLKDPVQREKRQDEFKENLGKSLTNQKKKNHLRNLFFVSNTEDADDVFEEIRQCISSQAMDMKDWGQDCQLKMLLFQQVLEQLKDSNVHISTTKTLLKIAKHENIGIHRDEDVIKCLQYCHDIGTIIYFKEENLQYYVILDPKWLVSAFRCLVSDKIENIIKTSDDWLKLKETGELTGKLITDLFKKEPKLKFLENKSHLLEVMKRFDIIVNLKNSSALYMPCMMKTCRFEEVRKKFFDESQSFYRTSWLCLDFEFLPPALFNHILAWYIKQYSVSEITEKGTRNERKALYRQIGVFNLDSSGCEQLVVCEGPNVIALQIWNSRRSAKRYEELRTNLCQFVDTLRNRYRLKITFTISFKCEDGDFTINRQKMKILLSKDYRCLEHKTNHISEDLAQPWYVGEEMRWIRDQELQRDIEKLKRWPITDQERIKDQEQLLDLSLAQISDQSSESDGDN